MSGRATGASYWWLRTPNSATNAYNVAAAGTTNTNNNVTNSYGVRPIYLV